MEQKDKCSSASIPSDAQEKAHAVNSAEDVKRRLLEGRAVEAVIWGMPIAPDKPLFDKSWKLPDIEIVKQ